MGQAKNTILIVDDVELNRDVLSIMFSQSHEIEFAESGPEALDILRKKKDDICAILLDELPPKKATLKEVAFCVKSIQLKRNNWSVLFLENSKVIEK